MSRKLTAAAVALALAGGVYLSCGTAQASNMGFKLERDFAFVPGFRNLYFVTFPLFNGLGDIAGATGSPGSNRCNFTPDGVVDANDFVCDAFTDRNTCTTCSFAITKLDTATCQFVTVKADKSAILGITFQGTAWSLTQDPNREIGYVVNVANGATSPVPTNRAVIVGSHDPSFTGHTVSQATCSRDYLAVPYHTMYQKAVELLCGLEGTDWVDTTPADGRPDTCPNGVFDPVSRRRVAVTTFDNVVGNNEFPNTDNNFITYQVEIPFGTALVFQGNNFSLAPGEAYLVNLAAGYQPRPFLPPHF